MLTFNIKKIFLKIDIKKTNLLKTNTIPFEGVKDVYPLPGAGQNRPLPLLLPPHVQIEDDLLIGGPCPTWRSEKNLCVVRLATHKLIASVDAVFVAIFFLRSFCHSGSTVLANSDGWQVASYLVHHKAPENS